MPQKKKNIIEKIVKKDYNNELEEILEQKQFGEDAKSTLLSILYKIEVAYKDLETVKKDIQSKEEYILNILEIIKNEINSIKIIKMSDEKNKIPDNKTYLINKEKKEIISYPIERKLLYAISKIGKKEKIVKDDYFLINETLSELINVGNNIQTVEPIRDFNGYSWTTISKEIESIDHNLVYQNLRILIGYKFLNKWIKSSEFIIDYFELFKYELEDKYGKENEKKVIELISKISVLLSCKFDNTKNEKLIKIKQEIEKELEKIQNKEKFIEDITKRKIEIEGKMRDIETIVRDEKALKDEYTKRNKKLPIDKKIFSMRVLSKLMEQEREEYFKQLQKLNKIINPQNFIKYKEELEQKYKYLKVLDEEKEEQLNELKIELQKVFLNAIKININKSQTKQEIEKIIYDFRYYLLLPYNKEKTIQKVQKLQKSITEITELIIKKAIELKVIEKISNNEETNYEILKNIFNIRIIKLEDAYLKITKEKEKYYLQIFDENIFEDKIEILKPEELEIKPNKKISIWC